MGYQQNTKHQGHSSLNNVPILNIIGLIDLKNDVVIGTKQCSTRDVRFGGKADIRFVFPITVFIGGNCQEFSFGGDWEKHKPHLLSLASVMPATLNSPVS